MIFSDSTNFYKSFREFAQGFSNEYSILWFIANDAIDIRFRYHLSYVIIYTMNDDAISSLAFGNYILIENDAELEMIGKRVKAISHPLLTFKATDGECKRGRLSFLFSPVSRRNNVRISIRIHVGVNTERKEKNIIYTIYL